MSIRSDWQIGVEEVVIIMSRLPSRTSISSIDTCNGEESGKATSNFEEKQERILLEPYNYLIQMPGKSVRTKLIQAFNHWMKIDAEKIEVVSDITQMLHNASLLIDDIEDNSVLRRGIPVAHSIYGVASTINTANYMYFLALSKVLQLGRPEATQVFTEQLLELHRGQGMDIYWRDSYTCPTEVEYRAMVEKKTGGLFNLAVRLMQLFAAADVQADFCQLAQTLGLYFQIRDDYANLCSLDYEVNKSYCEDLTEGKFSFPIIHGIRHDPSDRRIMSILRQRTHSREVKQYCVKLLHEAGSFIYTKHVLTDLLEKAVKQIAGLGGNDNLLDLLTGLAKDHMEESHGAGGEGNPVLNQSL